MSQTPHAVVADHQSATIGTAWSAEEGAARARRLFAEHIGGGPDGVWAAPGRVNIIGEHTDYNNGFCLPIALPHRTYVAARRRDDDKVVLVSQLDDSVLTWEGALDEIAPGAVTGWKAYTGGVAWALRQAGHDLGGFEAALVTCVPLGAGLSSSAAVECGVGLALADLYDLGLTDSDPGRTDLVNAARAAENEVAKAPTGGLDQTASLRTIEGHALLIDCDDWSVRQVPFNLHAADLELLVIDTRAPHRLVDGQYESRRRACEDAARILGVGSLRDIGDLGAAVAALDDEEMANRVRHVVTENDRVTQFVKLLDTGRIREVGALLDASHDSLRDGYEVTCPELDTAVDAARAAGALGARMTGGGFGGCAIALVNRDSCNEVATQVANSFRNAGFVHPEFYVVTPGPAALRVQ
ncbi:galactokinase [Cutibacterium namnetense]|uniref:Galactokinase n=1 Tax=[Propionibacterium] namnetense SK182B-JCVI TaxID=1051006 RepID=F9NUS2_9ACTN|nr:galactokinase [Cutibacterium namnetense]EGR97201.1 galactokinase [ [[Propionibacterium] namnetense SK182B-JCVI]